jgi:uncharacterized protein YdiU (UPF0061 family)
MSHPPQAYRPESAILELGDEFYDPVDAAHFPETRLRFRNDRAAQEVGLAGYDDAEWIAHFGRFQPLPGSLTRPLALRYHGHQFRVYNPEIGDGRGFLFAQLRDDRDRLMDLGTKGSGQTPWSRFGDGRLTLKGGWSIMSCAISMGRSPAKTALCDCSTMSSGGPPGWRQAIWRPDSSTACSTATTSM